MGLLMSRDTPDQCTVFMSCICVNCNIYNKFAYFGVHPYIPLACTMVYRLACITVWLDNKSLGGNARVSSVALDETRVIKSVVCWFWMCRMVSHHTILSSFVQAIFYALP